MNTGEKCETPPGTSDDEHVVENLVEEDANPYDIDELLDVDTEEGDGSDVYRAPGEPKEKPDDWEPDCIPPRPNNDAGSKDG